LCLDDTDLVGNIKSITVLVELNKRFLLTTRGD